MTGAPSWRPGLRLLAAHGLIEKVGESTRGPRAYYRMPDPDGVEQALTRCPPRSDPRVQFGHFPRATTARAARRAA